MAKIYSPPKEVGSVPEFSINDLDAHYAREKKYIEDVKAWAKKNGTGELAGEVVRFPVADGYAEYVVLSLKPTALIHLPIGDAWRFSYDHRLTASDLKKEVKRQKTFESIFKTIFRK